MDDMIGANLTLTRFLSDCWKSRRKHDRSRANILGQYIREASERAKSTAFIMKDNIYTPSQDAKKNLIKYFVATMMT